MQKGQTFEEPGKLAQSHNLRKVRMAAKCPAAGLSGSAVLVPVHVIIEPFVHTAVLVVFDQTRVSGSV